MVFYICIYNINLEGSEVFVYIRRICVGEFRLYANMDNGGTNSKLEKPVYFYSKGIKS